MQTADITCTYVELPPKSEPKRSRKVADVSGPAGLTQETNTLADRIIAADATRADAINTKRHDILGLINGGLTPKREQEARSRIGRLLKLANQVTKAKSKPEQHWEDDEVESPTDLAIA